MTNTTNKLTVGNHVANAIVTVLVLTPHDAVAWVAGAAPKAGRWVKGNAVPWAARGVVLLVLALIGVQDAGRWLDTQTPRVVGWVQGAVAGTKAAVWAAVPYAIGFTAVVAVAALVVLGSL